MNKILTILLLFVSLAAGATHYYVKIGGNDGLAGTSDATAWATIAKVTGSTFTAGDTISFKRGDTFRGQLVVPSSGSAGNHIVFDAYGTGAKPKLLGSKDISSTSDWTNHSGNIWKTAVKLGAYSFYVTNYDVGNLIFNNEASYGWRVETVGEVISQGRWFYNVADSLVYLYSASNPGSFYSHIECGGVYGEVVVRVGSTKHHITVRNLDARYSGNHGIYLDRSNNAIVEYCDVSWIGGWIAMIDGRGMIRQGNGICAWLSGTSTYDLVIRNNKVWQCFDAGISPQGANNVSSNINMYNNIIYDCYYSYEWWCTTGQTNTGINFFNNTCFNAGNCWSFEQRPDSDNSAHVIIWSLTGTVSNSAITNNIFKDCINHGLRIDDNIAKITLDYNVYDMAIMGEMYETTTYTTFAQWLTAALQDAHSIDENPVFFNAYDFRLQSWSPAIDAGINTGLTTDFAGNSRPVNSIYDIGAYEYYATPEPPPVGGVILGTGNGNNLMVDKNGKLIIIQ